MYEPQEPKGLSHDIVRIVLVAVAAVCLLLSLICLIMVAQLKSDVQIMAEDQKSTLSYATTIMQQNKELGSRLDAMEEEAAKQAAASPAPVSSPEITVTKQPMTVETVVGREGALMFSVTATCQGSDLKFIWQKQNTETNTWEDIEFVAPGVNEALGIRLYDNSVNGESQLWTNVLTEKAFGAYRCVITNALGTQVTSDIVAVNERIEG